MPALERSESVSIRVYPWSKNPCKFVQFVSVLGRFPSLSVLDPLDRICPTPCGSIAGMKNENIENTGEFETEYDTLDPISDNRNGKIAALSRDIRESLNRRIRKRQPSPDILEWLNAEPSVLEVLEKRFEGKPVTRQNLAEWRHGGFKQWARHRAVCLRLKHKQKGKRLDRHQLGEEMAQLYAEELTVTLDDLVDFAPDPEARMQRLEKGLNQIRGWRRSDYHAQRMALQTERMVLDKENALWRREHETQELALKEKRLLLDRDKHERNAAETIVNTCGNAQIRAAATRSDQWYGVRVKGVTKLMFGDEGKSPESISSAESGVQSHSNAPSGMQGADSSKTGAPPSENGTPPPAEGKPLGNGHMDAVQHPAPSHPVAPGCTQNAKGDESSPESKVQSPKSEVEAPSPKLQAPENNQTSGTNDSPAQSDKIQPSSADSKTFNDPQLSPDPDLKRGQIEKTMEAWRMKARNVGIHPPGTSSLDYALLRAYLSGEPCGWHDSRNDRNEIAEPPALDPRRDPASIWYEIAEKWAAAKRAGQV